LIRAPLSASAAFPLRVSKRYMRVNKRQASGLAPPRPTTHRVVAGSSSSARRAVMTSGRARLRGECRQHSCGPGGAQRDLARRHPTSASPELTGAIRAASANAPLSHPFSVFGGRGRTVWGCGDGPEIFMRDWKLSSPHGSRQRGSKPGPPRRRRLCTRWIGCVFFSSRRHPPQQPNTTTLKWQ